ncbi:hypothetical protein E4V42_23190 [Clostridium estertheticum]|nr:hypothetical protein [Clostridium estertheticum]MPQ34293.1 hypothetical protein [Clostridium estertheticum]
MILLLVPMSAQAQVNSISSDTKITKDNISNVLNYLNIVPSGFIKTDVKNGSVRTIKDLQKIIEQYKGMPREIKQESIENKPVPASVTDNTGLTTNNTLASAANSNGTVMLYSTAVQGAYSLTYSVGGQYSGGAWTNATGAAVSVDTDATTTVFKIGSQSLSATHNATNIRLDSVVRVDYYVGVDKVGLIKFTDQTTTGVRNWNTSYIPNSYAYHYNLRFQQFYNSVTQTSSPISIDGVYGPSTANAYRTMGTLIRGNYATPYCLKFQQFYNSVTQTSSPIATDGVYGTSTANAYTKLGSLLNGTY